MKQMYRFFMALFAMLMISTQGVEANPVTPRTKQRLIHFGFDHGHHGGIYFYRGTRYFTKHGMFYAFHRGRWIVVDAPLGMRVRRLPAGARPVQTSHGIVFVYKGAGYMEMRGQQGFVIVKAPLRKQIRRNRHKNQFRW